VRRSKSQSSIRQSTRSNSCVSDRETAKRTNFLHRLGTALFLAPSSELTYEGLEISREAKMGVAQQSIRPMTECLNKGAESVVDTPLAFPLLSLCNAPRFSHNASSSRFPRCPRRPVTKTFPPVNSSSKRLYRQEASRRLVRL
jgi:hypothetical protein